MPIYLYNALQSTPVFSPLAVLSKTRRPVAEYGQYMVDYVACYIIVYNSIPLWLSKLFSAICRGWKGQTDRTWNSWTQIYMFVTAYFVPDMYRTCCFSMLPCATVPSLVPFPYSQGVLEHSLRVIKYKKHTFHSISCLRFDLTRSSLRWDSLPVRFLNFIWFCYMRLTSTCRRSRMSGILHMGYAH